MLFALTDAQPQGGRKIPFMRIWACFARGGEAAERNVRRMEDVPSVEEFTAFGAEVIATTEAAC